MIHNFSLFIFYDIIYINLIFLALPFDLQSPWASQWSAMVPGAHLMAGGAVTPPFTPTSAAFTNAMPPYASATPPFVSATPPFVTGTPPFIELPTSIAGTQCSSLLHQQTTPPSATGVGGHYSMTPMTSVSQSASHAHQPFNSIANNLRAKALQFNSVYQPSYAGLQPVVQQSVPLQ